MKRVLVDMSATIIHHGHIRLLRKAKEYGYVVVALTTDEEILNSKGFIPKLKYEERREIIQSIRYVDDVVPCAWLIDDLFLDKHKIDLMIHGDDNQNDVSPNRLLILPRTQGISSSLLRGDIQAASATNVS